MAEPHFNEAFLTGENSAKAVLGKVYKDVAFPFTQSTVFAGTNNNDEKERVAQYWYYDSNETPLYLKKDTLTALMVTLKKNTPEIVIQ